MDVKTMTSQHDERDLVDKVLIGYTALLSEMTRFYETDFSPLEKQPKVRELLFYPRICMMRNC